ncbi:universal stress protein [Streptomyces sp. GS7]|uniref:universal stress protein n=1 Tax=Streptomyces sp. GS7 TaxID=2692234 RepID=UPI00131973EB|nr:universal stress protein [Streptomyces sp. GS7]QHC23014.1 universal stress protein [Streptomyces sp. GS7]
MSGESRERGRIVVGVDGSESSEEALRWAVRQAELTDSTVDAVTAWEYPPLYGSIGWIDAPQELASDMKAAASQALDHAVKEAVAPEQQARIHSVLAYGTPAAVLLDQARGADLLVVGSRGHGGFAGALLGSVGQHCTQHAPCPVVVVRRQ